MIAIDAEQQTELENIRSYRFNRFDGEQIVTDLLNYPQLWEKAWMENTYGEGKWEDKDWFPDSLVILAPDRDSASRLLELGAEWGSDGLSARGVADGQWRVGGWWD